MDIKICGLCRPRDARLAASAGATHAGVIRIAGAARWRPLDVARAVLDDAEGLRRVGVFADTGRAAILEEAAALGLDVVQLHGGESAEEVVALKAEGLEVWKVVKPGDGAALLDAAARYRAADLLLVEGSSQAGLGGVGARFDWEVVAVTLGALPPGTRIGVAGGLSPENVTEAVRRFRPALVDVSSGVERSRGEKDPVRVGSFVTRARAAAAAESAEREP